MQSKASRAHTKGSGRSERVFTFLCRLFSRSANSAQWQASENSSSWLSCTCFQQSEREREESARALILPCSERNISLVPLLLLLGWWSARCVPIIGPEYKQPELHALHRREDYSSARLNSIRITRRTHLLQSSAVPAG